MSTDYYIFLNSNEISDVLRIMGTVDGVKVAGDALTIEGLILTECEELDSSHRQELRFGASREPAQKSPAARELLIVLFLSLGTTLRAIR